MSKKVGVLANNQPASAKPRAHIPRECADFLVNHLAAEKLSQKIIRFLHHGSVFNYLGELRKRLDVPEPLPSMEIPGIRFREPQSAEWREAHLYHQSARRIEEARMTMGL